MTISSFWNALRRCKTLSDDDHETKLARVLNVFDLTALGVGSTLGLGVYVLAGSVAKTVAGPAVCVSFLVAAIASAFAGLCYAEFAARVPKAGSAYVYSYVSVGEFIAYTIGWNLILEYVIGTAAVAKGMSNYIDALAGDAMKKFFIKYIPINVSFLADYPDFFAFFLVMVITVLLTIGVKESTRLNNVFTFLNIATVVTVVVAGSTKANILNWTIPKENITDEYLPIAGEGGFAPFGIAGIMAGAAKCFFGFVGFDCVATTGEEAINPKKSIPISIVLSLIIIFLSYFSISTVLTLMWPYYLQDADAPFPYVFEMTGLPAIKWIVTIGAICALCTSLFGAMFPLPRVLYAMGNDGVLYRIFSRINSKTLTPILATILSGILTGIMASLFNLNQLIDMMSIGTLMAYTIVAISVLVLRFEEEYNCQIGNQNKHNPYSGWSFFKKLFNLSGIKHPDDSSSTISKILIFIFFVLALAFSACFVWVTENAWIISVFTLGALTLITLIMIYRQPMQNPNITFKVPFVPLLPCISVFMNLYLMVQLDFETWIRFLVWLFIGYVIYFTYGIRNSSERITNGLDNPAFIDENYTTKNMKTPVEINTNSTKF